MWGAAQCHSELAAMLVCNRRGGFELPEKKGVSSRIRYAALAVLLTLMIWQGWSGSVADPKNHSR